MLVIAGEHSGDQHAARMVAGLKRLHPQLRITALGGAALREAGAQLLWDLTELSVVGFVEVLKHYRLFKALFEATVRWIQEYQPRCVCFVDYPGFNLRLAERLWKEGLTRKGGGSIRALYYISPQVWAWKSGRRFQMARWLDALAVIFPFEVDFFKDTDLPVNFVGHPFVSESFKLSVRYDKEGPLLLLPGSRQAAVGRIFPQMLAALERRLRDYPEQQALAVYPDPKIRELLEHLITQQPPQVRERIHLVPHTTPAAGSVVLTSSGTMSLACALAGVPGAIVYRAHPFTYFWARRLVKVPFLGIANLLLKQPIYPEYIQGQAQPMRLADEIRACLEDRERLAVTQRAAADLHAELGNEGALSPEAWLESNGINGSSA